MRRPLGLFSLIAEVLAVALAAAALFRRADSVCVGEGDSFAFATLLRLPCFNSSELKQVP